MGGKPRAATTDCFLRRGEGWWVSVEQHVSNVNSKRGANALRVALANASATDLVATLGFSCYIVWELLGVFDTLPFIAPAFPAEQLPLLRVCLFLFLSIGFFAAMKTAVRVRRQARLFLVLGGASTALVLVLALTSTAIEDPPLWLGIVAWSVFGVSLTGLMAAWAVYFSRRFGTTTPLVITTGYAAGFGLFLLLSALAPVGGTPFFLLAGIIVAVSTIGFLTFLLLAQPQEGQETVDASDLDQHPRTMRLAPPRMPYARTLHATAYGVSYGFTITFLLSTGTASAVIGAIGGLAGCVTALLALSRNRLATGSDIRRITFIPVAVALLFLPIGAPSSYILCSLPIIAATIFTAVTSWVAVALDVDRKGYDPVTAFASNKWPGWFGFFLGTFASTIVIEAAPSLFTIVVAGLVAFICVSFAVFELRIYEDRHDEARSERRGNGENADGADGGGTHEKRFQARCDGIARAYGLSPRESEVFRLLAKGRNAEYISQELCIARPTTKTHIQHIYQKLTINSHQELIDLIDSRE